MNKKLLEVLEPFQGVDNIFQIQEDGTKQTELSNKGRFGFWVERQFGLLPNKDQWPDLDGVELKSVLVEGTASRPVFKPIAIGNLTASEHRALVEGTLPWENTLPFRKTSNTLYVFYRRTVDFWYSIDRQCHVSINEQSQIFLDRLEKDLKKLIGQITQLSYDELKKSGHNFGTELVTIKPKGDANYVYPCWYFTKEWVSMMYRAQPQSI